jgi:long-chain acyl-CoA synthetase
MADNVGASFAMFLAMFGISPDAGNIHLVGSPLYHTAVLMFTGCSLHFGYAVALMDKWTPESMLAVIARLASRPRTWYRRGSIGS